MALDVFISHAPVSMPEARKLADALRAHGLSTWVDGDNVLPGQDRPATLKDVLEASRAIVFLIEPGREPGTALRNEWSEALQAAWSRPGKHLIPVLLEDAQAPAFLQDRRALRIKDEPRDWDRASRDLAEALRAEPTAQELDRSEGEEARAAWRRRLREIEAAANDLRHRE